MANQGQEKPTNPRSRKHLAAPGPAGLPCDNQGLDLLQLRKPPRLVLAVEQHAVHLYIEHTAASRDQFDLKPCQLLKCGGQTGRPGQVVSDTAIGDGNAHPILPMTPCYTPGFGLPA